MKLRNLALLLIPAAWLLSQASPDLQVTAVSGPLNTDSQTLVTTGSLSVAIANTGGAATAGGFQVLAFEDRNGNGRYDAGTDQSLGTAAVATAVPAGGVRTLSLPVSGTLLFKGNIVYVMVDSGGAVTEGNEENNIRHTGQTSVFSFPASTALNPQVKWLRDTFLEIPGSRDVTNAPVVGDINGDGIPDIAFTTFDPLTGEFQDGVLRVVSGDTGVPILSITDPALQVHPGAGIALADIDGDGRPEMITADESCRLIAFEHDGALKWRATQHLSGGGNSNCWVTVAAADLDQNGSVELVVGNMVYNSAGTLLWTGAGATGGFSNTARASVVADLDLDGNLEVIAGPTAYRADGSIYWDARNSDPLYGITDGFVAVANLDGDPYPEIVLRPYLTFGVHVLEHNGTVKWTNTSNLNFVRGGPPVIADFDNDGQVEIGIADIQRFIVYETDGSVKWSLPIADGTSGVTSASVFDFNGDGSAEVVFGDEQNFYIVRGSDGFVLNQFPRSSSTALEMPIVADVDGDGHADIVVPATSVFGAGQRGIRVYSGGNGNWANSRKVWNQHAYSITNINDDLTVPRTVVPNWLTAGMNHFRVNGVSSSLTAPNAAPDLIPSLVRRVEPNYPAQTELVARVGNGGASPAGVHRVEFRNGPGGALLGATNTTRPLAPGEFEDVRVLWLNPPAGLTNVVVSVDTAGVVLEGDETNNTAAAQLLIGQGPLVTVDDLIPRSKDGGADLKWTPVPGAVSYNVYRRTGTDAAAAIRNGLVTSLGAFSDAGLVNNTTYFYNVKWVNAQGVESALGTEGSATPIPRTQRGDTPPTITSSPATRGRTGVAYQYLPVATDPDTGETLSWSVVTLPAGMTVNSTNGRLDWTPGAGQGGTYRIALRVTDSRNRVSTQTFNLFIETQILNNAPLFTSRPLTSGAVGRLYAYGLKATDADATDVLTYALVSGPSGMTVNPSTGLVQWTPGAVGNVPVSVRVTDLAGATVSQSWTIAVTNQNRGPVITSTPGRLATVGQTYSYTPAATDADPGDVLSWRLVNGPLNMTVSPTTGVVLWTPIANQVGSPSVTIEVRDVIGAIATQTWTIATSAIVNLPPMITSTAPTVSQVGGLFRYQLTATDPENDALFYSVVTGPAGMTVSTTGLVQWSPAANQTGANPVTLRVGDVFGNGVQQSFVVTVSGADTTPPTVTILSPASNATVTGDVVITGTVTDANLSSWELEYQVKGGTTWTRLAEGTTNVTNAALATFAASLLEDNPYVIRLVGRDQTQAVVAAQEVRVEAGQYKPGAFQASFDDFNVPAGNLPIVIRRVYDSTKPYANDFGRGWSMGYGMMDLRTDTNFNVFVTMPSGRRTKFLFAPFQSNPIFPTLENGYQAPQGSGDELVNLDCPQFLGGSSGLVCLGGLTPLQQYAPRNFRLKTREGFTFLLKDGLVTEVTDRAGNKTTISATGINSWNGRNIVIVRDASGRISQITDSRGARMRYTYDAAGRLTSVEDQLGRVNSYVYFGSTHLITEFRSPNNCTGSRQEYDAAGRVVAFTDAAGQRTQIAYDVTGRTRTVTLPTGAVMTESYDAMGNLLSRNDGTGRVTTYTYDSSNRITSITLPTGRRTVYAYDATGNLLSESNTPVVGAPIVTSYQYNALNLIERITRPNGDTVNFSYDALGNLILREVRDAANAVVESESSTWDAQGRRTSTTNGAGVTKTFQYNAASDVIQERWPSGATWNYSYDSVGNMVSVFDAAGVQTQIDYDGNNKVTAIRQGGVTLARYTWNEFGKVASSADGLNQTTTFGYNCSGELVTTTNPQGTVQRYTRTSRGQIGAITDGMNRTTTYGYDGMGRELTRTTPDGGTTTTAWTPDSLLASLVRPNGGTIQASYDGYGRLSQETRPDRTISFGYDLLSRLVSGNDVQQFATVSNQYSWNAAQRMVSSTQAGSRTVGLAYNLAGQRTRMTGPDGTITNYSYNGDGRLSEVAVGTNWSRFTYDGNGRRTQLLHSNGSSVAYGYNSRGQTSSLVLRDGTGTVIRSWALSYDAVGRMTSAVLNDGAISWTYDNLNRLTGETIASPSLGNRIANWSYDAVGNRLDASALFGLDYRLLQNATSTFGYDANGNQTQRGFNVMGYDVMNQRRNYNGNGYNFDILGRRYQRGGIEFVFDESRLVQMYAFNVPSDRYVMNPETNEPLFVLKGSTPYFYLPGLQRSIHAVTDSAGAVVHRYGYTAWGEVVQDSGVMSFLLGTPMFSPFGFAGGLHDAESGTVLFQARSYDPAVGRFLEKDPLQGVVHDAATQHPYIYAKNNPLFYSDPSGLVAAAEYNIMVTQNRLTKVAGAFIGTGWGFSGNILYFLASFISQVTPTGFDLVSAWSSAAKAAENYGESVMKVAEKYDSESIPLADGVINGLTAGSSAGCGVTAPGAPSVLPAGFGHSPQLNGAGGTGITGKIGPGGPSLSYSPPSVIGFQAGGLGCGQALANSWISANKP